MTLTDIAASAVGQAKAKIDAVDRESATLIPRIQDAYRKAQEAEKQGFNQSLNASIALGQVLSETKDKVVKGGLRWSDWRAEHIPQITQTKASLCMRLYKNRNRLLKPDTATEDGRRISDAVATALADGKMSVRKAAALLTDRTRKDGRRRRTNEDIAREYLKVLAVDELALVLKDVFDAEYIGELAKALTTQASGMQPAEMRPDYPSPSTQAPVEPPPASPASSSVGAGIRRPL